MTQRVVVLMMVLLLVHIVLTTTTAAHVITYIIVTVLMVILDVTGVWCVQIGCIHVGNDVMQGIRERTFVCQRWLASELDS